METTEQGSKHWHGNVMCFEVECDPMYIFAHAPRSGWWDKPEEINQAEPDTMLASQLIHPENDLKTMVATIQEPPVLDIFSGVDEFKHEWSFVQFSFGSWTECSCGYRPDTQDEFDQHSKENNIQIDIPGERGEHPHKRVPTYDVNPIHDGVDSSGIVQHTSMVAAIRDMVGILSGEAWLDEGHAYGWHIQYNDGTRNPPMAEYVLPESREEHYQ